MESDEQNVIDEEDGEAVEIYSRRAIWWFSIIPSPLFGGVLLSINLWAAGFKTAILQVMGFAIAATIGAELLVSKLLVIYKIAIPKSYVVTDVAQAEKFILVSLVGVVIQLISATILTRYFFNKYFPDKDYYPKSIAGPLTVAIFLLLLNLFSAR